MEFVDGESLAESVSRGPLGIDEAVLIVLQIASGLQVAHDQDIVHRDIKTGNVMLSAKGEAKILDLGLA
jgi:serine/threonine protein kinase